MRKKILFVTKALWVGGIEIALINLLNHLNYEKYDVTLLVLKAELDVVDRISSKCRLLIVDREKTISFNEKYKYSKLFHLTEETDNPSKFHKIMMWSVPIIRWIENRLYIRYIKNLMKNEYFDTAIIYSDVVAEMTIRAINADKYLMFYHHGSMRHVYHDDIAYKKCNKIIAVSKNIEIELKKYVSKYQDKIISIHNLTDIDGIREMGKLSCTDVFNNSEFNIVSVGRVSYEKGMDIAIRACAKLVDDGFVNIKWWIVGDGPAMQDVLNLVEKLHMSNYVKLVGMKNNPYPYIKQADLYVQPSRIESFGLTIKEAMILGKKIISTNTLGAREIITCENDGIICDISKDALAYEIEKNIHISLNGEKESHNYESQFERENFNIMKQLEEIF